jgi:Fe-S cluster assembly ATPase SufC
VHQQDPPWLLACTFAIDRLLDVARTTKCCCSACAGAGKTTLLTALAGRASYGTLSGKVTINGRWAISLGSTT